MNAIVDAPVIVDAHVNGNATVGVLDAVDDRLRDRTSSMSSDDRVPADATTVSITAMPGFASAAAITRALTSPATHTSTLAEAA